MGTLINGRGVVEDFTNIPEIVLNEQCEENQIISIEDYRSMVFTDKEEWDNIYNPKRCSIEALNYIEVKKRGTGPVKKYYKSFTDTEEGPYYDPLGIHVCVWKPDNRINNFICEQVPNSKNIQFADYKEGIYCAICHRKKECTEFNWSKINRNKRPRDVIKLSKPVIYPPNQVTESIPQEKRTSNAIPNWVKLMIKVKHTLYNDKIVYPISKYKSILMWPWQMTYYQKFRYSNPEYKDSEIFLKSDMENFREDYAFIE